MKIIAFYGPQQAGKSEAAKAVASMPGWVKLSFADPLYEMLSALLGVEARKLDKSQPAAGLCGQTVRRALQTLGTEWGREMIGQNIWLDAMHRRLGRHYLFDGVVIDDLRFANEYRFLRERGATIVRVNRSGVCAKSLNSHGSEVDWVDFKPDLTVENYDDLDQWQDYWRNALVGMTDTEPVSPGEYEAQLAEDRQAESTERMRGLRSC